MFLLGCEKARVDYPTKTVFESLSLGVNTGDRIGIVGRNGDGKSTLLGLLSGSVEPDEGRVITTRGVDVGVLKQADDLDDASTVGFSIVGDTPEYVWAGNARTRAVIAALVGDLPWDAPVGTLSGGQRRRVDLARLLVGDHEVLMLDEPTNHLDIRAISWLAGHLKSRWRAGEGALLVVTHDRWFLDEVCLNMWEVHDGRIDPFEGGFSAYIMQRVERDRLAARAEEKRQAQLRHELAWLSRGARARATKPKFHVKHAQELIADVPELRNEIELKRMAMARLGKQVVDLTDVTVRFEGGATPLQNLSWIIGPGDRYGIVGENGAGKTTLLKVIQGALTPSAGRVKIGATVRFAVLSQNLENLTAYGADRVRQVIGRYSCRVMLDGKEATPAQLLERLGFSRDDLNEPVCDLSGGQKRRLALMLILLDEPNVLILDEPGNDLDTDMLAAMEDLLDGWPGTLLLVTHDRYLMERVTDHQFALIDGQMRHLPRGVEEYLELVQGRRSPQGASLIDELFTPANPANRPQPHAAASSRNAQSTESTASACALPQAEVRRLRKLMASNERKMETQRVRISDEQTAMLQINPSDYEALIAAQERIAAYQEALDALELEWLEAAEQLGE